MQWLRSKGQQTSSGKQAMACRSALDSYITYVIILFFFFFYYYHYHYTFLLWLFIPYSRNIIWYIELAFNKTEINYQKLEGPKPNLLEALTCLQLHLLPSYSISVYNLFPLHRCSATQPAVGTSLMQEHPPVPQSTPQTTPQGRPQASSTRPSTWPHPWHHTATSRPPNGSRVSPREGEGGCCSLRGSLTYPEEFLLLLLTHRHVLLKW